MDTLSIAEEVKDEIRAAVAAGREATVSAGTITMAGWTGVGYIISDPETGAGAGAYRISGGGNGGTMSSFLDNIINIISFLSSEYIAPLIAVIGEKYINFISFISGLLDIIISCWGNPNFNKGLIAFSVLFSMFLLWGGVMAFLFTTGLGVFAGSASSVLLGKIVAFFIAGIGMGIALQEWKRKHGCSSD